MKSWSRGRRLGKAEDPGRTSDVREEAVTDEELGIDEPDQPAPKNRLWHGELGDGEMLDPDDSNDMLDWMEEHEPEIHQGYMTYAYGYLEGEKKYQTQGRNQLMAAEQYLAPEYSEMTPEQRELALENVEIMIRDMEPKAWDTDEFSIATAKAMAAARADVDLAEIMDVEDDEEEDVDEDDASEEEEDA